MNNSQGEDKIDVGIKAQNKSELTSEDIDDAKIKAAMDKEPIVVSAKENIKNKPSGRRAKRDAARQKRMQAVQNQNKESQPQDTSGVIPPPKGAEEISPSLAQKRPVPSTPEEESRENPDAESQVEAGNSDQPPEETEQTTQEEQSPDESGEGEDNPENPESQEGQEVEKQKLNWYNKMKKQAMDRYKAGLEKVKSKFTKQAVGAFLKALVTNPYFWIILAAIFIILLIFASCKSGKTPYQALDPVKDKKLTLEFRSYSGEKAAQRELIGTIATEIKSDLKGITTDNPEAQANIKKINTLLDEIVALSDSPDAVKARIVQLIDLLDKLKQLLPQFASLIDQIKEKLYSINKFLDAFQKQKLVINPKDLDYAREYSLDRRVVQMLVYLVTPTEYGGAGHERIKVKRIKFGYDTERKGLSKETDYSEKEEPNVSAHYTGQAADITEIDYVKCTQIKRRRVLKDKKKKLPPVPIKVAWQTDEGFMKTGGPQAFGQNMHELFTNFGTGAINELLVSQIADILGIDIDMDKLEGKSWVEIMRYVGQAYLKETLGIPGDYELGNSVDDIAKNIGRAYIAESLGVPFEGIQGDNQDEIMLNAGRAIVEEKMGLPFGSLEGNSSEEIFSSIGKRKMEGSLGLKRGTLGIPYSGSDGFKRALGQGRVEEAMGLPARSFYGGSLDDVKKRLTKESFDETFSNFDIADNALGIPSGTTDSMTNGRISPDSYNEIVGGEVIKRQMDVYQKTDKRAEAYDIPSGDISDFVNGDKSSFVSIGKYTAAKALSAEDSEIAKLVSWFNTKTKPADLDSDYLGNQVSLRPGDVENIFILDLGQQVFRRIGKVQIVDYLEQSPVTGQYMDVVKEIRFYTDRLNTISDNFKALKNNSSDPTVKQKADDAISTINGMLSEPSVKEIKSNLKRLQEDLKTITDKSDKSDIKTQDRVRAIEKAVTEIIEGREINDFESFSSDSIKIKSDPQSGLTKKDILLVLTGKKKADELATSIGLSKWENELDLPAGSLTEVYKEMKSKGFSNGDETLLISIGKSAFKENGSGNSDDIDKRFNLKSGTTADFRSGKLTENAYYKQVGQGVLNGSAAKLLNSQLGLDDPAYALTGSDVSKLLTGGWLAPIMKIGGKAIDEALGLPPGGAADIIQQVSDQKLSPEEAATKLAEKKLGMLAGIDRPVSLEGDIPYNLGKAKIEQYLGLKANELTEGNLVDKVKNYTNSDKDNLSRLDATFGIKGGSSSGLINGSISSKDYITLVGNYLKTNVIYETLANFAPDLKNKEIKDAVLALANKTGTPEEILQAAGANRIGEMLGLDYPVSIRGNFTENLGEATIEQRLGLKQNTFKENLDKVISLNTTGKVESAFRIESGKLDSARKGEASYWTDENKNNAKLVDSSLNIQSGSTQSLITGQLDIPGYISRVGTSTTQEITTEKLIDFLGLDDKYSQGVKDVVKIFQSDPSLSSPSSKTQLYKSLYTMANLDLDNKTGFDPGTWEKILFVDPANPSGTGIKNADKILLEQGKKYSSKWLGLSDKYDPYMDLIYEKGTGLNDQKAMRDAIREITGIPDTEAGNADADRLLRGDVKGGLYAIGASMIVKNYNEEFKDSEKKSELDYKTVRDALFGNPDAFKASGDAAVEKFKKECGGCSISPEMEQSIRNDAVGIAKNQAKKDLQYAVVDMQLHKLDANMPAGFAKAMFEGTSEQKWGAGLSYLGNMVHSQNSDIPPEIFNELNAYFNPDSPKFHDPSALSSSTFAFLDTQMGHIFGNFIQPGTAQALMKFGQTGKLGSPGEQGTLTQIYADYGINIVTNWADNMLGTPAGTTKMIYDYYTKFQSAYAQYQSANAAYTAAKTAENAEKLKQSEMNYNSLKAEFYSFVITQVFSKQLRALETSVGLVPGSANLLVSAGVQYLIGAGNPAITLAIFVVWNLIGVYRVDIICTACGYYPDGGDAGAGWWGGVAGKVFFPTKGSSTAGLCPLGEFNGIDSNSYKLGVVAGAQYKVNQLIGEALGMPEKLKDENMLPSQIMTKRQEDVDSYASKLDILYGKGSDRGNMGLWANDLMWDHIHIGF